MLWRTYPYKELIRDMTEEERIFMGMLFSSEELELVEKKMYNGEATPAGWLFA